MLLKFKSKCPSFLIQREYDDTDFQRTCKEFLHEMTSCKQHLQASVPLFIEQSPNCVFGLSFLSKLEDYYPFNEADFNNCIQQAYALSLRKFCDEIEHLCEVYGQCHKNPPYPRNLPPIAGKITWARHLRKRLQDPMPYFLKFDKKAGKPKVLGSDLGIKVIKNYNKLATTLLMFEELWYDGWRKKVRRYAILLFCSIIKKERM